MQLYVVLAEAEVVERSSMSRLVISIWFVVQCLRCQLRGRAAVGEFGYLISSQSACQLILVPNIGGVDFSLRRSEVLAPVCQASEGFYSENSY